MDKQSGMSVAGVAVAVLLLGAAGGGGFFAWQQYQELGRTKTELSSTKSALDKANGDARAAKADAAAARKELDDQKSAFEQAKSERDAAVAFLESEKGHAARLQGELTLAREQIAHMRTRTASPAYAPQQPTTVRVIPSRIEAIQVQRPQAVGVGVNPMAPQSGQGYSR